jgi:opacity protein-like surface antigen
VSGRRAATLALLAAALAVPAAAADLERAVGTITAADAYAAVERLTAPEFAGRLTGTRGYAAAAAWAADELRAAGLGAPPDRPDYLQPFEVTLGGVESAAMRLLSANEGEEPRELELSKGFVPFLFSGSGDAAAEVVFVGFGISAPELGRDDYAGLDVAGKVVMAVRGAPKDGRDWRAHDSHRRRTANARAHGAAGYLFAESAIANPNGEPIADLPMAAISEEVADELLSGRDLKLAELRKVLSQGGVASFATGRRVRLAVQARPAQRAEGHNVVAIVPGGDPALAGEYVVVGAHLDHCGDWPVLLPGADDNASGSAAVLEIARAAAVLAPRPRRTLVFVLFGGEEMGLLGSQHFVRNPPAGLSRCVAMLNLDVIGAGNGVWVAGGENFPAVCAALSAARERWAPGFGVTCGRVDLTAEARADHGPFLVAGIPAVSLFGSGGHHVGYHSGNDSTWWITPRTIEAAARTVFGAAVALADAAPAP